MKLDRNTVHVFNFLTIIGFKNNNLCFIINYIPLLLVFLFGL